MVNPSYKLVLKKKQKHRAGKITHAARAASHLRWLKKQSSKGKPRIKSIEEVSLSPDTLTKLKTSIKSTFYFQAYSESKRHISDPTGLLEYSPELILFQDLYQSVNYQRENCQNHNSEIPQPKDLISQIKSQFPKELFYINEYKQYLNL